MRAAGAEGESYAEIDRQHQSGPDSPAGWGPAALCPVVRRRIPVAIDQSLTEEQLFGCGPSTSGECRFSLMDRAHAAPRHDPGGGVGALGRTLSRGVPGAGGWMSRAALYHRATTSAGEIKNSTCFFTSS